MKLIVGLGNPGPEYTFTPHNAGFLAIDRLAERYSTAVVNRRGRALTGKATIRGQQVLLAKPETFMNLSGESVAALLRELGITNQAEDLIVLYDELAIPLGQIRVRERGSAGGHNGVKSILAHLGTEEWIRIRIGVGKPPTKTGREGWSVGRAGGTDYLLSPMRRTQLEDLDVALDQAVQAVEMALTDGVKKAMNEFNRKVTGLEPEDPKGK